MRGGEGLGEWAVTGEMVVLWGMVKRPGTGVQDPRLDADVPDDPRGRKRRSDVCA